MAWSGSLAPCPLTLTPCFVNNDYITAENIQSWIFIGRTNAEAEAPILWPPDAKNWLIRKDPGAGKDWRQEKKGTTGDEMFGLHHWLIRHEFEQTLGVGDGQGRLGCCSPWGYKELDTTEWLNSWESLIALCASQGTRLATSYFCFVSIYKLHLESPWGQVSSGLLLRQPGKNKCICSSYGSLSFLPAS